jgi:hypothetical protein
MKQLSGADKIAVCLLVIAAAAVFALMLRDVHTFGVDDSYIFFRYAENLANGQGFVFNPGEPPGEGFTSWAWLLLLALCHYLGLDVIFASKLLGVLFHLSAGLVLYLAINKTLHWLTDKSSLSPLTSAAAACAFIVNYRLIAHGVSGMETSLYVFGIVLLAYLTAAALCAPPADQRWWLILGIAALGIFLVRPEGIAAGGISLLALAVHQKHNLLKPGTWLYITLSLAAPLALFIIMKIMIFGYPLPHSFYHKFIVIQSEYGESLEKMLLFFKSYWALIGAAAAAALYAVIKHKKYLFLYFPLLFAVMVGLYLLFYPAMNYLHRFYIPYLSLLFIMIAPGLHLLVEKTRGLKLPAAGLLIAPLLAAALALGMNIDLQTPRFRIKSWTQMIDPSHSRAQLGVLMNRLPRGATVANTEMGVIPYYSGLTCIDMAGLTDPHTAHRGVSMDYLEKRKVDLILFHRDVDTLTDADWKKYTLPYDRVFLTKKFIDHFKLIGFHSNYYIYADKTSPNYARINSWGSEHLKK